MTSHRSAPVTPGILLVAFGTRTPQALAVYRLVQTKVHAVFPDIPLRWVDHLKTSIDTFS